jgi:hypothetical protein
VMDDSEALTGQSSVTSSSAIWACFGPTLTRSSGAARASRVKACGRFSFPTAAIRESVRFRSGPLGSIALRHSASTLDEGCSRARRRSDAPAPAPTIRATRNHSADAHQVSALTGAYTNEEPRYLQSTGFLLDPDGRVLNAVYSRGPIGRLVAEDVIGMVTYLKSKA